MYKFISTILLLFPIWGWAQPTFQMGTDTSTDECEGRLFDSGGEFGAYGADEFFEFTICPTDPHDCIAIDVEFWDLENIVDELVIYEGTGGSATVLTAFSGTDTNRQVTAQPGCITIEFSSDFSIQYEGFSLSWKCQSSPCNFPVFSSCNAPQVIGSLPFDESQITTCLAGNNITNNPCGTQYIQGEEYVFAYDSPGEECISILIPDAPTFTGVGVYDSCPDQASQCLGYGEVPDNSQMMDAWIPSVYLKEPGRYYIVVANPDNCIDFDIEIEQVDCGDIQPPAADCSAAISLNSCAFLGVSNLNIQPSRSDGDFIEVGVNNGCWGAFSNSDFTWFYFEAQADGTFGFILRSTDPNTESDYDINVYGPIDQVADVCDYTKNNDPIRSTYADLINGYEETGLTDTNPISGINILDTCEDEIGDGFVQTIAVQKGEIYAILINDFDVLVSVTSLELDFSETDPAVLIPPDELPIVQISPESINPCEGDLVQLEALTNLSGGTFLWSTGEQIPSIEFIADNDQMVSVIYESDNGCGSAFDSIIVEVGAPFSIDSIQILPEELDSLLVGCEIDAVAIVSPDDVQIEAWEWFVNGTLFSNQETLAYIIEEEGILNIEVKISSTDCDASFSLSENVFPLREVEIPNIFSPNGDSRNDFFRPIISAKAAIIDMKIFNRWGQKVYDNDSNASGWNGRLESSDLPTDVYVYQITIELPSGQRINKQGDVTLLR